MAISSFRAGPINLTTSAVTYYTYSGSKEAHLKRIHVVNFSGSPANFTLSIGTDASGKRLYDSTLIPSGGVLTDDIWMPLFPSETLQAKASAGSALTMTISGVEL